MTQPRVHPATALRAMLGRPHLIRGINVYDPLTARLAETSGFDMVALGGYQQGAASCVPEPTLTMTEVIEGARLITKIVKIPLKIDCGAGFGEAVHVTRTIREAESAHVACLHIEDQHYPKRAHYHRFDEQVIGLEEMLVKIRAALAARTTDLVLVGRTDSIQTHGLDEAIRRGCAFAEAGCDMVEVFPNTAQEARIVAREVRAPLIYVNSSGNRKGRPIFSWAQLEDMGYRMCIDSAAVILSAVAAVQSTMRTYIETGLPPAAVASNADLRRTIESLIGLEEYYEIEERTLGLGKHSIK